ncbi:MAG: 2-C-methyl-D-erythritol 4-phosphate cytidylyltransferase [Alphaproteobacteria bacterium]|nr:2-C-methyl-D-erythritol 4-phosphate cytidylyltransferase [Alphaproteobacteria bacterium]
MQHRGKSLLEHAVEFLSTVAVWIVVGLPTGQVDEGQALLGGLNAHCIAGGASKQETVALLLDQVSEPLIIVHDVSEFMADPDLLARLLALIGEDDAVVPVERLRVRGSLATIDADGWMESRVDRERLVSSYCPQVYRREALVQAFIQAQRDGWHETGIYALVHRAGGKVCLVEDGGEHLKLTYPEDLAVLENT